MVGKIISEDVQRQLKNFIQAEIAPQVINNEGLLLSPLSGDAGFRQYFRLNTCMPLLAVWAPVETEDSAQFCRLSKYLNEHGVRAPRVFAVDLEKGFLAVEDFGDALLQSNLNEQTVEGYYSEALTMLLRLQSAPVSDTDHEIFPPYDALRLEQELELFEEWYLQKLLGLTLNLEQKQTLIECNQALICSALTQPQVVVHRDFHCRNLIIQGNGALATIDFQDAVCGPITYDLVSLLKDCYVKWDLPRVEKWALAYASLAQAAGLIEDISETEFLKAFDLMGLQRHIKVLGVFSRLYLRDDKSRYLADLPRVLSYVLEASRRYEEFEAFHNFLRETAVPLAQQNHANLFMLD